jgi:hypothetical protein
LPPLNAVEGGTTPGLRLFEWTVEPVDALRALACYVVALWCEGDLFGHGPQEPHALTRNRHDHLVGVFPPRCQTAGACAPARVGFPTEILEGCGVLFASQLHVATDVRGLPIGPGAFNPHATGMGLARFGDGTLTTPLTRGVSRGHQAQELHQSSGIINAREVAECSGHRDRPGALDAASGRQGLAPRRHVPDVDLRVECSCKTRQAFGGFGNRPPICLEGEVLRGGDPPRQRARARGLGPTWPGP